MPTAMYNPVNVFKGVVVCGHRHIHCIHQVLSMTGKRQAESGAYTQGFLTNTNRFVDRVEGAKIALESGQIKKLGYSSKELFSEDLY